MTNDRRAGPPQEAGRCPPTCLVLVRSAPVELHQYRSTYGRGPRSACIEVTRHAASPPEPDIDGDTLKQGQ
jgi:hypothetical protein